MNTAIPARRFVFSAPKSPLNGVSAPAWLQYATAMEVQSLSAVSEYGGLGIYTMHPARLVELGYADGLRRVEHEGRMVQICDFALPWTRKRFLTDALAQNAAFAKSNLLYHTAIMSGEIKKPDDCSVAGVLAVLHVGGHKALEKWPKLLKHTQAMYDAAQGAF